MSGPRAESVDGFLLAREWRDAGDGIEITLWVATDRGVVRAVFTGERAVCFVDRDRDTGADGPERRPLELLSPTGNPVDALYFRSQSGLRNWVAGRRSDSTLYESDIGPADRFLMERFVQGPLRLTGTVGGGGRYPLYRNPRVEPGEFRPRPSILSLDIETDYRADRILSIGLSGDQGERVLMVRPPSLPDRDHPGLEPCADERGLLARFLELVDEGDPDVIIGWNVIAFDLALIERRCRGLGLPFAIGRERAPGRILEPRQGGGALARIPGRVVMDGIESLRAAFYQFESFSLEHVASRLLGRGKLIDESDGVHRGEEVLRLYREDPHGLARYNLEDCRLVREIFDATALIPFALERAASTGLALGRTGGSVAAFDFVYLPRLHRRGYVAPTADPGRGGGLSSPGGYVLDSVPGLFDDVLVLDFKSLYPSIIRTFLVDPLALWLPGGDRVEGFDGASFSRDRPILPEIIEQLWRRRDQAKRDANAPLSQAVKIIMNSFYGVLGASACRFFDPRLTSSITRRGHRIILRSKRFIEERGLAVIYGDTDSLFVHLDGNPQESSARDTGARLAADLNDFWRREIAERHDLDSHLEIEFETHYLKFLMPTVRGSDAGSKKRYAGMVRRDGRTELVFKGLEAVRSDWTRLAREFQHELFRRIFQGQPYRDYVRETHAALYRGELDHALVYRKQLRQDLDQYRRNVPPHVRAARKLDNPGRVIEYLMCPGGPEPARFSGLVPDYDHYAERQLKPVADTILHAVDSSYDDIVGGQLELFSAPR